MKATDEAAEILRSAARPRSRMAYRTTWGAHGFSAAEAASLAAVVLVAAFFLVRAFV